jgi:hypothetical protein
MSKIEVKKCLRCGGELVEGKILGYVSISLAKKGGVF